VQPGSYTKCYKFVSGSPEQKLQDELGEWKPDKEIWRCGMMQLFGAFHCYLKKRIQELLGNERKQQI
jgi:hypothetical protein